MRPGASADALLALLAVIARRTQPETRRASSASTGRSASTSLR